METDDVRRRYVCQLVDWALAPPGNRAAKRALNHPLQEFHARARKLAGQYYFQSLDTLWGASRVEFVDECIEKVFEWVKKNTDQLMQTDFTDDRLEGYIRKTARNLRVDLRRKIERARLQSIDTPAGRDSAANMPEHDATDSTFEGLGDEPRGRWFLRNPDLQMEFARAQKIIPAFGQSLRGEIKMRQMLSLLLRLGRKYRNKRLLPAYWFVLRILKKRRSHLPKFLRDILQESFPDATYLVINTRLGYLRRAFETFCVQ